MTLTFFFCVNHLPHSLYSILCDKLCNTHVHPLDLYTLITWTFHYSFLLCFIASYSLPPALLFEIVHDWCFLEFILSQRKHVLVSVRPLHYLVKCFCVLLVEGSFMMSIASLLLCFVSILAKFKLWLHRS